MYLLRTEAGLSAGQAGRVLGRSRGTVRDLSRLVARGERASELVAQVRQTLSHRVSAGPTDEAVYGWMPRGLPGLEASRIAAGLTQPELAARAGVARETLSRLEHGRPARPDAIGRLAVALSARPSTLMEASPFSQHWSATGTRHRNGHAALDARGEARLSRFRPVRDSAAVRRVRPMSPKTAGHLVPGLERCRRNAGLTQEQLAWRVGLARETLTRIARGRPARVNTVRLLARALQVMPSMLTGTPDLDPVDQPARRCAECNALRPVQAFVAIRGTNGYYGRCRMCRNARARTRYWSSPEILSAERERARRNKRLR